MHMNMKEFAPQIWVGPDFKGIIVYVSPPVENSVGEPGNDVRTRMDLDMISPHDMGRTIGNVSVAARTILMSALDGLGKDATPRHAACALGFVQISRSRTTQDAFESECRMTEPREGGGR